MPRSKLADIRHAVGYGTADGVERTESSIRRHVLLDIFDDTMELIQRLRGL